MSSQRGSFLLQALLALTLVFAFIPFFASKIASRDAATQMYAATEQVETAYAAARSYVRENKDVFPYKKTELSGVKFLNTLGPYGLPMGFIPITSLRQQLSLVVDKNDKGLISYIKIVGGKLSKMQVAELARRIGFYAEMKNNDTIHVYIPIDTMYSDIVAKKETDENVGFLSELDMNYNSIEKINLLFARNGHFETGQYGILSLYGVESSGRQKNKIEDLFADKTVFRAADGGAALSISHGDLHVGDISLRTISKFGSASSFESNVAAVYDFSMAEGRTSFVGPSDWLVRGSVRADNFNFTVEQLSIGAYIDASRGQDVYIDPSSLEYNTKSGIDVQIISAANITLRDQTSYGLLNGQTGAVLVDIRPAGTSLLPDVYVDNIDNNAFEIIVSPDDTTGKNVNCKDIIDSLDGNYNSKSLAQNIICQYVFWQRLENRIDIKQCLMNGRDDCM